MSPGFLVFICLRPPFFQVRSVWMKGQVFRAMMNDSPLSGIYFFIMVTALLQHFTLFEYYL
jgi:hypothetical protein